MTAEKRRLLIETGLLNPDGTRVEKRPPQGPQDAIAYPEAVELSAADLNGDTPK